MIERLTGWRRVATVLTLSTLGAAACGGHIEGVVGLDLIDCSKNTGSDKNVISLSHFVAGDSFHLGASVYVTSSTELKDGLAVVSRGGGKAEITQMTGEIQLGGVTIADERGGNTLVADLAKEDLIYTEDNEQYTLSTQKKNGEFQLQIEARCVNLSTPQANPSK